MNYLTEIKLFYDWLETHPMTPSAIALWHGLMFIANRQGWEDVITIPLSVLESRTGIPSTTLYRIRKQLQEADLIEVLSPGGRACAAYRILSFESRFAFQNGKQNERQMEDKSEVGRESSEFAFQNGNCPRLAISSLEKRLDNKIESLTTFQSKEVKAPQYLLFVLVSLV